LYIQVLQAQTQMCGNTKIGYISWS
jgi:hypothetical protein